MRQWMKCAMALAWYVTAVSATVVAQAPPPPRLQLASVQVIDRPDGWPMLRVQANGPLAFEVVRIDGAPDDGSRLTLRLPDTDAGVVAVDGSLAPFVVSATREAHALRLEIATGAVPGLRLVARAGQGPHQIDVVLMYTNVR